MEYRKILRSVVPVLLAALGLWAFCALALPVLWPFCIGLAVSLLAQKPVQLLQQRAHLPRWLASGVCVLVLFAAVGTGVFFLCRLLCREAMGFARELPQLAAQTAPLLARIKAWLLSLARCLPDGLGTGLRAGVESFFSSGALLGSRLYERAFSWASGLLGKLPDVVLFAMTAILSSFMLSAQLPSIRAWLRRTLSETTRTRLLSLATPVHKALGGWVRAQLKLMGLTFLLITVGLLLLRMQYPLLMALVTTLVDALPVFGTGTILIPWALLLFLRGQTRAGVGLVILYGAAALSRQALEPRLVGKQVGLSPVLALLALYTGYRLLGVGGMIVFPLGAVLIKQLWTHSGLRGHG